MKIFDSNGSNVLRTRILYTEILVSRKSEALLRGFLSISTLALSPLFPRLSRTIMSLQFTMYPRTDFIASIGRCAENSVYSYQARDQLIVTQFRPPAKIHVMESRFKITKEDGKFSRALAIKILSSGLHRTDINRILSRRSFFL